MTQKNPFELRADVLALAKEYMDKQVELNMTYAIQLGDRLALSADELKALYKPYTFEELMAKATEMYSFVQKKD